jgi:DNA-binding response OmpR family regulator
MSNLLNSNSAQKSHPSEKKILVFDDDDQIRQMVQLQLELEGFKVKVGRDGRNVLAVALEFKPDLIVTDLMMPGGGGYEVLHSLQSDSLTRKVPVLMMSGANLDASTKALMKSESNVVDYLEKPLHLQSFLTKVHSILKTKNLEERMIDDQLKMGDINLDKYNF